MEAMIDQILQIEWDMFQHVRSIGGRASCQDDRETFDIMRRSQYENWTPEMNRCYLQYLEKCRLQGRNLVTEKYARMMRYTDPDYYKEEIEPVLPPVPPHHIPIIDHIVKILVNWELEFASAYPLLAQAGRPITAEGDATGFTSLETYARGELETYPFSLLSFYADYVDNLLRQGKSLSRMMQETTVRLYGYPSIEEAEKSLLPANS